MLLYSTMKEDSIKLLRKLRKIILVKKYLVLILLFIIFLLGNFYISVLKDLPSPSKLSSSEIPQSSEIYDRGDKLLFTIYKTRDRTSVPLSQVPKYMREASIAVEDKNFYYHGAIDLKGLTRAFFSTVFKRKIQGGSTLTQQLVKNSLLTPERTILRKVREIILSFATEAVYSKDQILEMYLNQVPYGGTAWGVEAAAKTYFGKKAKDLTLAEATLLAGLPEAPTTYSPFGAHPDLGKRRQAHVLSQMLKEGYITKEEEQKALKEPLKFKKFSNTIKAPHFVLYVKDLLVQKYGQRTVEEGGLKVKTTLDLSLQELAQNVVATEVGKLRFSRVSNGGALVTNPATGEILAMVGSKDYFDESIDGNVNVTLALRQPGSAIKPVNYATGLIKGYTAATPFVDNKICFPNQGGRTYCPVNYDGKFHGVVSMRTALASSINVPAVKMLKLNGIENMIETAQKIGITTFKDPSNYGLSLTLGGGEVTMLDMAQAFGVFANGGYRVDLKPILKVEGPDGKVLEEYKPPKSPIFGKKVIPSGVSFIISDILADNNARLLAFGPNSVLKIDEKRVSVKTGTTNDFRDNWTIGFTQNFVVAAWVGNNDGRPMGTIVSGVTGAAPIWRNIMVSLTKDKPIATLQKPSDVIQKQVCEGSGLLSKIESPCKTYLEYFVKGDEPTKFDPGRQKIWVNKDTKMPPPPGVADTNLELKEETIVEDATGEKYCASCPKPPEPSPSPTPQ